MANKKNTGKTAKIILGAAAIAAAIIIVKKMAGNVKSLEYLDYGIASVKANFSNPLKPTLNVVATISNPNETPVPVKGIFGKIAYSGMVIAVFENIAPIEIGGRKKGTISIVAKVSSLGIVATIVSILKNSNAKKTIIVDGMLQTGFFEQPFTQTLNLS